VGILNDLYQNGYEGSRAAMGFCGECAMMQIGGNHYEEKAVQAWDAMQSWMSQEQFEGFLRGCVIKYIARYPDKNGLEDLLKAQHYLTKLIESSQGQVSLEFIDEMTELKKSAPVQVYKKPSTKAFGLGQ